MARMAAAAAAVAAACPKGIFIFEKRLYLAQFSAAATATTTSPAIGKRP